QNPVSSKIIIREGASSRDPQVLIIAPSAALLAILVIGIAFGYRKTRTTTTDNPDPDLHELARD
ncbi:hypothetical protein BST43_25745, partial [Mycobacteroides saopaulense]